MIPHEQKPWNRDFIKYLAMLAMLINHISNVFVPEGTFVHEIMLDIGYFTAITMCYFLVEGYDYTHSKKKYALRLLLFAVISQVPYCLAFTKGKIIQMQQWNMMFTLLICFLIVWALDEIKRPELRAVTVYALVILTAYSDWALLAPVFTLLFVWAKYSDKRKKIAFAAAGGMFFIFNFIETAGDMSFAKSVIYSLGCDLGILMSAVCILYLYNGKRAETGRAFSKWFFYLFYPLHLLVIGLVRTL